MNQQGAVLPEPRLRRVRPQDKPHVQELLDAAAARDLTRSEAVSLFFLIRGDSPRPSVLRDIGDTIAHDHRDRGDTFAFVNRWIDHVVEVGNNGGMLGISVLYQIDRLIEELVELAERLGLDADRSALEARKDPIGRAVAGILSGTTVEVQEGVTAEFVFGSEPGPRVEFFKDREAGLPVVLVRFVDGVPGSHLDLPPGLAMGIPLVLGPREPLNYFIAPRDPGKASFKRPPTA